MFVCVWICLGVCVCMHVCEFVCMCVCVCVCVCVWGGCLCGCLCRCEPSWFYCTYLTMLFTCYIWPVFLWFFFALHFLTWLAVIGKLFPYGILKILHWQFITIVLCFVNVNYKYHNLYWKRCNAALSVFVRMIICIWNDIVVLIKIFFKKLSMSFPLISLFVLTYLFIVLRVFKKYEINPKCLDTPLLSSNNFHIQYSLPKSNPDNHKLCLKRHITSST